MEVMSEEESRQVIASMTSPFTKHTDDDYRPSSPQQEVLLIHGPGQEYKLTQDHHVPEPSSPEEILVRVIVVGLNPVDWKGPDYNFGMPSLPWINGRDFAGVVVKASKELRRIRVGDVIMSPSTDYRDIRKAAFQEYVISTESNCARVPRDVPIQQSAAIGVAYVAASLALGVCLGVDFTSAYGPDLLALMRVYSPVSIPEDIRTECMGGIALPERAKKGDWIAIWGGSTATGLVALQLARFVGLRTICVADVARHGALLSAAGVDVLVDRLDTTRAVEIIQGVTNGRLRYGLDAVGNSTAELLQSALTTDGEQKSHLVGLTGLPKMAASNVVHHQVPIKAFHSLPRIGEALMVWLENLLVEGRLVTPQVEVAHGGLHVINNALDRLREGKISGKRIVVPLQQIHAAA